MTSPTRTIRIENLFSGLISPLYSQGGGGLEGNIKTPTQYSRTNGIDLFRPSFEGHITPARIFDGTAVTSNINSLPRAKVNYPATRTSSQYLILGGLSGTAPRWVHLQGGIYNNSGDIAPSSGNNFTTLTAGTGFWGEDIAVYNVSGVSKIFYSWNDNAQGDVGMIDPTNDSATDGWLSGHGSGSALSKNVPHRITEANDGNMYVTNGRYLVQYNGLTDVVVMESYDAGADWIITDIRPWKDFLIIICTKMGQAYVPSDYDTRSRANFWDYSEDGLGVVYDFNDPQATAAWIEEDVPYVFTQGKNQTVKLRQFTGTKWNIKKEWNLDIYGTAPLPTSIESYHNSICWIPGNSAGSFVMAYSVLYDGLHISHIVNNGMTDATVSGMLSNMIEDTLNVGSQLGASYGILAGNSSAGYHSNVTLRTLVYRLPYKAKITAIRIYFSQMKNGSSATFSLYKNYVSASRGTANIDMLSGKRQTVQFSVDGELTEFEILPTVVKASAFYMEVYLNGQISVPLIEVDYEPFGSGQ